MTLAIKLSNFFPKIIPRRDYKFLFSALDLTLTMTNIELKTSLTKNQIKLKLINLNRVLSKCVIVFIFLLYEFLKM